MSKLEKLLDRSSAKWAHPELAPGWEMPGAVPSPAASYLNTVDYTFEERKEMSRKFIEENEKASPKIDCDSYMIKGCEEEPDASEVKLDILYPENNKKKKIPCIYAITGGGLYCCVISAVWNLLKDFANEMGCALATVHYRTIFDEGGYPQTINDCHAGYKWLIENASSLGINPDKIVMWGQSSGCHLTLALCHRLKKYDWYGYKPRGCVVAAGIVDDRVHYPSSQIVVKGAWNSVEVDLSSRQWLGQMDYSRVPAEAFPNHATAEECIGLPPTFIHADECDSCVDSCSEYASKLTMAGVYTEFHRWGGSFHALPTTGLMGDCDYVKRFNTVFYGNLRDCLQYDLRREWIADLVAE